MQPGEIHVVTTLAEGALLNGNFHLFQRAGKLVRIVQALTKPINNQSYIKRPNDALIIVEVDFIYLTELLSRAADWHRYDVRQKGYKLIDCPERIAKTLIARKEWDLPVLSGIIQAPTLRFDGSILENPGYDKDTGLFFNPGHTMFPKIEEHPTFSQAEQALNLLLELFKDFPFEGEASKTVAISAILTGLIRRSIRTAPLHGFTAPKMSSGKSLLADVIGLVVTGRSNSFISQAENEADPVRLSLGNLLAAWYEIFGDLSVRAKDVVKRAFEETSETHEALKDALTDRATDSRGNLNQKMLGNKLSSFRNRIENGFRLESNGTSQRYTLWQVKKV